jgi:hypothetical protein
LRWDHVSNMLHGWMCSVMFDTPEHPELVKRYFGRVDCATAGAVPLLRNSRGDKSMVCPPWAIVVMHTPPTISEPW